MTPLTDRNISTSRELETLSLFQLPLIIQVSLALSDKYNGRLDGSRFWPNPTWENNPDFCILWSQSDG